MMPTVREAEALARELVGGIMPRWAHVRAAGRTAEELVQRAGLSERVAVAVWLHDVGYGAGIRETGFHPLDGARHLERLGIDDEIVRLVAWHTGAGFEAEQRGLIDDLTGFKAPEQVELDALTMVDLATGPDGTAVLDSRRIAEILSRYEDGDPVHEAVTRSTPFLLASSARAKERLGLPEEWPTIC
ncbi:HD domain-containing protein [Mobilicoccus pelagius]|uniref:HD domain-containing protein n=1 Tax=Mobilicoccus pelagius NBRC 104925 TaxID=1089455 RepID=H5UTC4_9MICO|nr:HD domain-containing protein [Mobilicoccus pelagius]GAB48982.1 hypothetical protein MOPEL_091_00270 [Mobilicoccus pelagius NBRC 104925]